MGRPVPKTEERHTYAGYLTWQDGGRWELIDGVPCAMTPAPSRRHQEISGALYVQLWQFLQGKTCRVYDAPFDVRLPEPGETDETTGTVVQPDIVVVCDPAKLDDRGCKGAPDLVIEILSPESAARDLGEKLTLYERSGVKEYWVIHPTDRTVMVFILGENGAYGRPTTFAPGARAPVATLPGLEIDLDQVFGVTPAGSPEAKAPPATGARAGKERKR
jgi:Uma2 family endonuclease